MKINVSDIQAGVRLDTALVEAKMESCLAYISNIQTLSEVGTFCTSKAYRAAEDYLVRLKIPLLFAHMAFLSTFVDDLATDNVEVSKLTPDGNGIVDTDLIDGEIASLEKMNVRLAEWLHVFSEVPLASKTRVSLIKRNNSARIENLQETKRKALAYAANSSIYFASKEASGRVARGTATLAKVFFNPVTHAFDLSGVGDWGWISPEDGLAYWKVHNQRVIERYLVFDDDGRPVAFTDDFTTLFLKRLFLFAIDGSSDLAGMDRILTNDEKYFLLYLVVNLHDPVYNFLFEEITKTEDSLREFSSAIQGIPFLEGFPDISFYTLAVGLLTLPFVGGFVEGTISFKMNGGNFTTSDSPTTIQGRGGFMDFYDPAVALLGMDIDTKVVAFLNGGFEYRIQFWDGRYGSFAGGGR
jgi:hypothetical protein